MVYFTLGFMTSSATQGQCPLEDQWHFTIAFLASFFFFSNHMLVIFPDLEASAYGHFKSSERSPGQNSKAQTSHLEIWLVFFTVDFNVRACYIPGTALQYLHNSNMQPHPQKKVPYGKDWIRSVMVSDHSWGARFSQEHCTLHIILYLSSNVSLNWWVMFTEDPQGELKMS